MVAKMHENQLHVIINLSVKLAREPRKCVDYEAVWLFLLQSAVVAKTLIECEFVAKALLRDLILLVCFSWRYEVTEGPHVNFVMREALFEIYTWILCRFIPS